jgi:regulator of sigma E protease
MTELIAMLGRAFDLALVVIGFGLIIFVHELGHFVAARWAGIRVLAFALGFGPAAISYRKGLGFRKGSSEEEYLRRLKVAAAGVTTLEGHRPARDEISPTEYRLNILPFGGYVKMLGQEDLNPEAVSAAPDSYQNCVPWKRMVVISAGVVMNIITAALIFMLVFKVGLKTEPAIVGFVNENSAAAEAVAINAKDLGILSPGLQPGDEIIEIDGKKPQQFADVVVAAAMSRRGTPVDVVVQRPGVDKPVRFAIKPKTSDGQRLLELGVGPANSNTLRSSRDPAAVREFEGRLAELGLVGVPAGSTLESIDGRGNVRFAHELDRAAAGGKPFTLTFRTPTGERRTVTLQPRAAFEDDAVKFGDREMTQRHLLGLSGVIRVETANDEAKKQGLRDGDVFVRLGPVEFPSIAAGVREIRAAAGRTIDAAVRRTVDGKTHDLKLPLRVSRAGTIGFGVDDTMSESTLLGAPLGARAVANDSPEPDAPRSKNLPTAAAATPIAPGSTIFAVDGTPVRNFTEVREAIRAGVGRDSRTVRFSVQPPTGDAATEVSFALAPSDVRALGELGWVSPVGVVAFEQEKILLKASGPLDAIAVGLGETKRVMLMTYMTFVRLFEGSVKVEHLKGPVGIAHTGTIIADRGMVWLLFFMALISVNLAVVNFLPLPIVDGGQFLFILYEQIFKRPVPIGFQNAATLAGLLLIGSMFIVVTFNDIMNLFRS